MSGTLYNLHGKSFDEIWESRFARLRKFLPQLGLRYPTDAEVAQLASLAKVGEFHPAIKGLIVDAHLSHLRLRGVLDSDVRDALRALQTKARELRNEFSAFDVGAGGAAAVAGALLEYGGELRYKDQLFLTPDWVALLDSLDAAVSTLCEAVVAKDGRPSRTQNPAFDIFVRSLLEAARRGNGGWTIYRNDNQWRGTLLVGLDILRPYLPPDFFPQGVILGRSLQHIRNKWRASFKPRGPAERRKGFRVTKSMLTRC